MPRFPPADWLAEQARLTVFPMPDATTRSPEWWQQVTDTQPDETTMNPKKGSGLIQGAIDPGKLILRLERDRIDWVLAPRDEPAADSEFPTLGPAMEVTNAFSAIVEKWLVRDDLPAVGRIAFGAVLMHQEADRQIGYQRLPDYVPVRVHPESTDFFYQILPNKPSSCAECNRNRGFAPEPSEQVERCRVEFGRPNFHSVGGPGKIGSQELRATPGIGYQYCAGPCRCDPPRTACRCIS